MTPPTTSAPITPLTPALQNVAEYLARGVTPAKIAAEMGLSQATIRQYIRNIREYLHFPRRCGLPVIVHSLIATRQVATPTADRPTPDLGTDQLLLLRAVAVHSDSRDIAVAAKLAPADLPAALDRLLAATGAPDPTQLVILGHSWELLTAAQTPAARNGASQ
ncbi:LuxR C-terminal-related transcriptional regulator [Streptomyces sp. NPDC059224]|uniref:LuxR C-terminal-related transcriptional regulator n=1 Tax=Streptomyces sp. NPDC059224 TaxID=3346775 RepID=UPI0036C4E0C8